MKKLNDWLQQRSIEQIILVSPHLDDAVFSQSTLIAENHLPMKVYTVFTEADENTHSHWAGVCGFANTFEEFSARRLEDIEAIRRLGSRHIHGGFPSGTMDSMTANSLCRAVADLSASLRTLLLLPLGAGSVLSSWEKMRRKLLRRPFGAPIHGEHVWVRDQLNERFRENDSISLACYAEIPYYFSNSKKELAKLSNDLLGPHQSVFTFNTDPEKKLEACKCYTSQVHQILGHKKAYMRTVCSQDEVLFLSG